MGYSGRYHAASLAAVFVALAIGILIGIGLADDVVSGAKQELVDSLRSDLDDARGEADDLRAQLDQERRFTDRAAPALVANRLARDRVALVALGDIPEDTAAEAQGAVEAAGADLASVAVLSLPPDLKALRQAAAGALAPGRRGPPGPARLGVAIGRQLVSGGPLLERTRELLFSRFNGSLRGVSRVVLVSTSPQALQGGLAGEGRAFEAGLLRGIDRQAAGAVGVEQSTTEPTTLGAFSNAGIATVDDIEQPPGQVALVFALLGAEGDFGIKDGASSLLPDPLPAPAPAAGQR